MNLFCPRLVLRNSARRNCHNEIKRVRNSTIALRTVEHRRVLRV